MRSSNWVLEPDKYLRKDQASRLLNLARHRAEAAQDKGRKVAIRDYFIIHLALITGLRVMEIAALRCNDIFLDDRICSVLVRKGKGNKKRVVYFTGLFRKHCKEYLKWKQDIGESIEHEAPLILSSNTGTHMTTRAVQKVFRRCAKLACLDSHYAIHCLRHTVWLLPVKSQQLESPSCPETAWSFENHHNPSLRRCNDARYWKSIKQTLFVEEKDEKRS